MPNRIDQKFAELRGRREGALVAFVTAGDPFPTVNGTADVIGAIVSAGADIIEIGIPYSDPLADGPVIQAAGQRALDNGVTPDFVFDVVKKVRESSEIPIILMGYYNPLLQMGLAHFADRMAAVGADGVIISDLPPEEADHWQHEADRCGIATIYLLAPTSNDARINSVTSSMKSGFVYCVSRTGVTGTRADVPADLGVLLTRIQAKTKLPVCVGFGVSTRVHVAAICRISSGAIVGSALVDCLHRNAIDENWNTTVQSFVSDLKIGTRPE